MTISIPLSKKGKNRGKHIALVDDCDGDLAIFNWTAQKDKDNHYVKRTDYTEQGKFRYKMHRVIMQRMIEPRKLEQHEFVDHISGDGLDNRRENLRLATREENSRNRKLNKNSTTRYKGVTLHKPSGRYYARITINGKRFHLGAFTTPQEASQAYKIAAKELHGKFARFE